MIQQPDKRVVFMVPLGDEHLMIGTTETPLSAMPATPSPTRDEIVYLLMAANQVLAKPIAVADIVHTVAGVRPLVVDPGKDARETSRDWRPDRKSAVAGKRVSVRVDFGGRRIIK